MRTLSLFVNMFLMQRFIFFLSLCYFSCNLRTEVTPTESATIDSLIRSNDSLRNQLQAIKIVNDQLTKETISVKKLLLGSWTLDFDKYKKLELNAASKNYFDQLAAAVSAFTYTFSANSRMRLTSKLRDPLAENTKIEGIFRISDNESLLEIERHSDEIVFDEPVQKFKIISIDDKLLHLRSEDLDFYFQKL